MSHRRAGLIALAPLACVLLGNNAQAQPPPQPESECRTIDESAGYVIRTVKVEGRWIPSLRQLNLSDLIGKNYSPVLVSQAQSKVSEFLQSDENKAIESGVLGVYSTLLVRSCTLADDQAKTVDVIIKPAYLRVDVYKVGSNTLPLPRSLLPTFYDAVPKPLLAFNPVFAADYDRQLGFAPSINLSTNLLDAPNLIKGEKVDSKSIRLDLKAFGQKSIENSFYNSDISLTLARQKPGTLVEDLAVTARFTGKGEPLGDGKHLRNSVQAGGYIRLRPHASLFGSIAIAGNYRGSNDRLSSVDGTGAIADTENALDARVITDGRVGGGFARLALWVDAASPNHASGSYRRMAGMFGIEKEFGSTNQTVGIEAIAGAGHAWGNVPQYARFFAGNSARNFLYDAPDAPSMITLPVGPLIRSFGAGQGVANSSPGVGTGGTSYWHVNLNLAVPLPRLSAPLIPNVTINDTDGTVRTLKEKLKGFAIGSAIGGIADTMFDQIFDELKKQGLSDDEATSKAAEISTARATKIVAREFKPTITYIADKANLFALKPLMMFDAARLNGPDGSSNRTRYALGGGVQLTIVVAKFEAGYLRSFHRMDGDPRGNFVLRLVVQNLF
jgi:hypothetical protein